MLCEAILMKKFALTLLLGIWTIVPAMPVWGQADIPVPTQRPDSQRPGPPKKQMPSDPVRTYQASCPALLQGTVTGRIVAPLSEDQCGEKSPLGITALNGEGVIKLGQEVIVNCRTAISLAAFAEMASRFARDALGSPISELVTGPGYQCRRRNRAITGKLSEHAFANAIDISAFKLEDGRTITVEEHWPHLPTGGINAEGEASPDQEAPPGPLERATSEEEAFLAQSHATACKMFTTVLGPDANASHRSHFHFDLGCHGRNCTYLLCE